MQRLTSVYGSILRPWICIVVYLWLLELQAAYRPGFEPLLDQLASASAILWTLLFWALLFSAVLALVGLPWRRSVVTHASEFICRTSCLLITAYFLRHWLGAWRPQQADRGPISWLLMIAVGILYWYVRRWRLRSPAVPIAQLPSWQDCFSFGALPVLLATVLVVGIKIANNVSRWKWVEAVPSAYSSRPQKEHAAARNVVVIVADAMRSQSMSLYGYGADTTPFLDRLAESSVVYTDMHSNSTATAISLSSILSGKHPLTHGRPTPEISPHYDPENLLGVLRAHGYATAAVTSNVDAGFRSLGLSADLTEHEETAFSFLTLSWLRDLGVYPTMLGEQMYADLSVIFPFLGFPQRTSYYGESEDTLNLAKQTISRLRQPFFLFVHLHQPHAPYSPISAYTRVGRFLAQFGITDQTELKMFEPYPPGSQPIADNYKRQYEASVRRVDSALGGFVPWLLAKSWFSNSLLIFTSDHGESFERGYMSHGEELYENSTRVPLLIRFPGQQHGHRVSGLVQALDIAPTILRALNLSVPIWMEGQPLLWGTPPEERATVAVNYKHPENDTVFPMPTKVAMWWQQYKMIANCPTGGSVLYDLANDPAEQNDLSAQRPLVVNDLKLLLKHQLSKQSRRSTFKCSDL